MPSSSEQACTLSYEPSLIEGVLFVMSSHTAAVSRSIAASAGLFHLQGLGRRNALWLDVRERGTAAVQSEVQHWAVSCTEYLVTCQEGTHGCLCLLVFCHSNLVLST
jgi:hypothetical protein